MPNPAIAVDAAVYQPLVLHEAVTHVLRTFFYLCVRARRGAPRTRKVSSTNFPKAKRPAKKLRDVIFIRLDAILVYFNRHIYRWAFPHDPAEW
jgi:hypothetical protein